MSLLLARQGPGATVVNAVGARATARTGSPVVTGDALVSVSAARSSTRVGTLAATGAAVVSISAARATGRHGTPSISSTVSASIAASGDRSTTRVGTPTAHGGAIALVTGARSTARDGTPAVKTGALASVSAARAHSRTGIPTASVAVSASIAASGARTSAQVGGPSAKGGALSLVGASVAQPRPAIPSATGGAAAAVLGARSASVTGWPVVSVGYDVTVAAAVARIITGVPNVVIISPPQRLNIAITRAPQSALYVSLAKQIETFAARTPTVIADAVMRSAFIATKVVAQIGVIMSSTAGNLYVDDVVTLTATATDVTNNTFTPDTAVLTVKDPAGTITTPTVTISGAVATATVPCALAGKYLYKWLIVKTSPPRQGAVNSWFSVNPASF